MATTKAIRLRTKSSSIPEVRINWKVALILVVCAIWFIFWLVRIAQNITMPQIEYSEGLMQYNSYLFSSGQWSWNITQPVGGYQVTYYTPMYYWVWGSLMHLFGTSLVVGRVITLVCFLACCGLVYLLVRHITKSQIVALISGLLPLCFTLTSTWSMFARCDFMAVMFELAGIYIALKYWRSGWLYASIPLFLLAFLAKQSSVVGVGAVCIALFWKNWRQIVTYGGIYLLALICIVLFGNVLTDGAFFKQVFLFQRTYPTFREGFIYLIVSGYIELIPLLVLAAIYLTRNYKSLIGIYTILAVVESWVTLSRPGGAANYCFEAILALIIVAGCVLPEVLTKKSQQYLMVLFIIPLIFLFLSTRLPSYPDSTYRDRVKETQAVIADTNFPILTDNFGLAFTAGKVPYYEGFVFSGLAHYGQWDESILINDLKSHRIKYVITQYPVGSDKVRRIDQEAEKVIMENYHAVLDYSDSRYNPTFVVYKANGE